MDQYYYGLLLILYCILEANCLVRLWLKREPAQICVSES